MAVTNAVSWRTEGISYKKNEVFLDVVESVNLLVNSNGETGWGGMSVAGALFKCTGLGRLGPAHCCP